MTHRTLNDLAERQLQNSNFEGIGAVYYIIHRSSKRLGGEYEMNKYYEAKMILLGRDVHKHPEGSRERKIAEKKLEGAKRMYKLTDPERDLPF